MPQQPEGNNYNTGLNGVRGIAIILVLLFHYFPEVKIFKIGWTGVDLFFVLSGFLLTSRILPFLLEKKLLLKFYWNRALRILPLYYLFLILFFLFWFMVIDRKVEQSPFYSHNWYLFFVFFQNWILITTPDNSASHLNHFWSLAVEEQVYLIYPLFFLLLKKRKNIFLGLVILLVVIVIARIITFYYNTGADNYKSIYCNTFFRSDSFLLGSLLYFFLNFYQSPVAIKIFKITS